MAVIPIYINCCNKVLVLLTDDYLTRLWCIWEMYCLFIYFKKEIAVRKLEIVPVPIEQDVRKSVVDDQKNLLERFVEGLENFSVDNAHAFSPNEEKKLKTIMYNMGVKNVDTLTDEIKKMVKKRVEEKWDEIKRVEEKLDKRDETTTTTDNPMHSSSHDLLESGCSDNHDKNSIELQRCKK